MCAFACGHLRVCCVRVHGGVSFLLDCKDVSYVNT